MRQIIFQPFFATNLIFEKIYGFFKNFFLLKIIRKQFCKCLQHRNRCFDIQIKNQKFPPNSTYLYLAVQPAVQALYCIGHMIQALRYIEYGHTYTVYNFLSLFSVQFSFERPCKNFCQIAQEFVLWSLKTVTVKINDSLQ